MLSDFFAPLREIYFSQRRKGAKEDKSVECPFVAVAFTMLS
jgi:hypothetical protein